MKLVIEKIGKKLPSKKTGGTCITVIMKDLDSSKIYKHYIDDTFDTNRRWLPHLKVGNVFDNVRALDNPKYRDVIDGASDFKVIKDLKPKSYRVLIDVRSEEKAVFADTFDSIDAAIQKLIDIRDRK